MRALISFLAILALAIGAWTCSNSDGNYGYYGYNNDDDDDDEDDDDDDEERDNQEAGDNGANINDINGDGIDTDGNMSTDVDQTGDCLASCYEIDLNNEDNYYCPAGTTAVIGTCASDFDVCCIEGNTNPDNGGCLGTCYELDLDNEANVFCPAGTARILEGNCASNFDVCCTDGGGAGTNVDNTNSNPAPQDNCPGQCMSTCEGEWVAIVGTCDASGGVCCELSQDTGEPVSADTDEPVCPDGVCMSAVDCVVDNEGTISGDCADENLVCCII
jgi:hypothetical protein